MSGANFYPLLGAVTITTGVNDVLKVTENATTASATLAAGTYYLRGDGTSDDLLKALKTAIEAATASTNTYLMDYTINADPSAANISLNVVRATGTDTFALLWAHASTTLPAAPFGFPTTSTANDANSKQSSLSSTVAWCADQPPASDDNLRSYAGAQDTMVAGGRRTFERGGPYKGRRLGFAYVNPKNVLAASAPSDTAKAFETFAALHRDGRRIEVHSQALFNALTSTNLAALSSSTLLGTYVMTGGLVDGDWNPERLEPGLELYGWSMDLREYVA